MKSIPRRHHSATIVRSSMSTLRSQLISVGEAHWIVTPGEFNY
jgi:hypothetical protein